jgi:hypothetical protein
MACTNEDLAPWQYDEGTGEIWHQGRPILGVVFYDPDESAKHKVGYQAAAAPDLLRALKRLSFAAMCRDNTMGDPCRLLEVKAELAAANVQAEEAIARAERQLLARAKPNTNHPPTEEP